MDSAENNEFLKQKLLEPRAKIKPHFYEYAALYAALYQSIYGSYVDYGFSDRAALDIAIKEKIRTIMKVADKILKANPDVPFEKFQNLKEEDFTDGTLVMPSPLLEHDKYHFLDEKQAFKQLIENNWLGNYVPLLSRKKEYPEIDPTTGKKRTEVVVDNTKYNSEGKDGPKTYISHFLECFDRSVGIAQDLTARVPKELKDGNMLNVTGARQLIKAEQFQLSELYEGWRYASAGQPFKYNKKDGKYGSGEYYEAFRGEGSDSAINKMKTKRRLLRKSWGKFALKAAGLLGFGALTIVSGGALLSFSGIAMSGIFASAFASMTAGSAVVAGAGLLGGGFIGSRFLLATARNIGDLYGKYVDLYNFKNGIGKYANKDGKPQGYKKLKEQYYTALALKEYFNKGTVKGLPRYARKCLKRYLKLNPGIESNKDFYQYVDKQEGSFQTLYRKLDNVVQAVPEQTEHRRMFANEATSYVRDRQKSTEFDVLLEASKVLEDYKTEIGVDNTRAFKTQMAGSYVDAFMANVYDKPLTPETYNLDKRMSVPEIKSTLEAGPKGTEMAHVQATFDFMATIKTPKRAYQSDFKLKTDLGVGIEQQIKLEKTSMVGACNSLDKGASASEKAKFENVAELIETLGNRSQESAVRTEINNISNEAVKKYLTSMLNKKVAVSRYTENQIKDSIAATPRPAALETKLAKIAKLIENIERKDDFEFKSGDKDSLAKIREFIMDSEGIPATVYTDNHKKLAMEMLEKQIQSIENKEFSDTEAKLVDTMKKGRFNKLSELVKHIKELSYDKIDSTEFSDWYTANIATNSNKAFLDVHIKTRIEELIINESTNGKYAGDSAASLTEILNLIKKIKNVTKIDSAQKYRLIVGLNDKIERAIGLKMSYLSTNFVSDYDDILKELKSLTEGADPPLKPFFDLNTPEVNLIKETLVYAKSLGDVRNWMRPVGLTLSDGGLEEHPEEAKLVSMVYMDIHRLPGDALYNRINSMSKIPNTLREDIFNLDGTDALKKASTIGYVNNLSDQLTQIRSGGLLLREQFAALIILKKYCVTAFKSHVDGFYRKIRSDGSTDIPSWISIDTNRAEFNLQVMDYWSTLFGDLQRELETVRDSLNSTPSERLEDETYSFIEINKIISQATKAQTCSSFATSTAQLQ